MKKLKSVLTPILLVVLCVCLVFAFGVALFSDHEDKDINTNYPIGSDSNRPSVGNGVPMTADLSFTAEDLEKNLTDYKKPILKTAIRDRDISRSVTRLRLIFDPEKKQGLDRGMKEFVLDASISREEKVESLLSMAKDADDKNLSYMLDVLSVFKPIEYVKEITDLWQRSNISDEVRAKIIGTIGDALTFIPGTRPTPEEANFLNGQISFAQNFLGQQIASQNESIRFAAMGEFVKSVPQDVASSVLSSVLDNSSIAPSQKADIKVALAISEPSAIQASIFQNLIDQSRVDLANRDAVTKKVIGTLNGSDSEKLLTQESKFALQSFLSTKEPVLNANATDPLISAAEYGEWVVAMSRASATSSHNADAWISDNLRSASDPLKLAATLNVASDSSIARLKIDGSIGVIASRIEQAKQSSSGGVSILFEDALEKLKSTQSSAVK
jgi:hypothetical protein